VGFGVVVLWQWQPANGKRKRANANRKRKRTSEITRDVATNWQLKGVTSKKSPCLAILFANRNGIPPNRAQRARAPGPEILTASRGNPVTKNHDIPLNLEPRIGQNRLNILVQQNCICCVKGAPK
jgi:hypothetical protein